LLSIIFPRDRYDYCVAESVATTPYLNPFGVYIARKI